MFDKLVKKIQNLAAAEEQFDPSTLDDPVALKTEWGPARGGGANFKTHKLVEVNYLRLEFQASMGAKLFYLIFFVVGFAIFSIFLTAELFSDEPFVFSADAMAPILVGLVFSVAGAALYYFGTAPIVFDKLKGAFWKGRKTEQAIPRRQPTKFAEIEKIYAVQLISERCSGSKGASFYSYELNLVLQDGSRINVIDHGNPDALREDAQAVSKFLDKPVWDAI